MIRRADPADPRLARAPGEPLVLAAVQALAKTAGPGLRREFWLAEDEAGAPLGAFCRTEGGLWATAAGETAPEAAAFLALFGALPATVDGGLAPLLPGRWERRPVLEYRGTQPAEPILCPPSCMGLADCCVSAGLAPPEARDDLYAELHLRIRRGAAQVVLVPDQRGGAAAGAANLLGEGRAVIGFLCCRRERQGRGYGTAALAAAVWAALERGRTPLLACREALLPFYTSRGFVPTGEIWERGAASAPSPGAAVNDLENHGGTHD